MLFTETVAVYCENRTRRLSTLQEQNAKDLSVFKEDWKYNYHCTVEC